jgi:SPP1 family predicted phage head-tail adaptor
MIQIGKMDKLITLESKTTAANAIGEMIETWSTLAEVWAEETPIGGSESFRANRPLSALTSKFSIWYRDDVGPKERINYAGRVWNISQVRELGRREALEITAEAVL